MSAEAKLIKTPYYSPWFSAKNFLTMAGNTAIRKSITRGAFWCKFQLHSTFQRGVMSAEAKLIKTPYYSLEQQSSVGAPQ